MNIFVYNPALLLPGLSVKWLLILIVAVFLLMLPHHPLTILFSCVLVAIPVAIMAWHNMHEEKVGARGRIVLDWIAKDMLENLKGFVTSTRSEYGLSDFEDEHEHAIYFYSDEDLYTIQNKIQDFLSSLRDFKTNKNLVRQSGSGAYGIVNFYLCMDGDRRMIYVSEGCPGQFRLSYARTDFR